MKKNTPEIWDKVWNNKTNKTEDISILLKEKNGIRWHKIKKIILSEFKTFENLNIIEIGAGLGTLSALMAKEGAKITIMDYSDKALEKSKEFYKRNNIQAKYIKENALNVKKELLNKYDISISSGLAEHFKGKERIKIIKTHFDVLKTNGITFISVPNKYNPPYRIYKFMAELLGTWNFGEEYPFSKKEFKKILKKININQYSFFGDSFYSSLTFINPMNIIRRITNSKKKIKQTIHKEKSTVLDNYISYSIILYGKK